MKTLKELGISPAPWSATADADGEIMVNDENRYGIAAFGFVAEGDVNYANARLVAAAPELYEALRLVLDTLEHYGFQPWFKDDPLAFAVKCGEKALEKAGGVK